jgi:signal transduction histidine kinase
MPLGAVVLVSSTREYGPANLRMAEEFALRAALSIDNARLYRAAERAVQVRDDVLGVVAHDLRNPLGTILMQAALLRRRESELGPSTRKPSEAIERAAKRMNDLIQDLLDVTRMEAGRLSIEPSRMPVRQLVSDALESQGPLASSCSIELRQQVEGDLPEVWADRDRLLQTFENLIGNALKFTDRAGRITVGASPRDGQVLFWVSDTGVGIDPEDVPHLFDRFWQAPGTRRQGAGLGLPIVKGIVEAHGGRIWIESKPGRGTTVFFTIPAAP